MEKQRSKEAEKQSSREAKKQGKKEKQKCRKAKKQGNRNPPKNAQNGKKNKKTWSSFLICTQSERWTATISYSYYNILITSIEGYVFLRLHSPFYGPKGVSILY